MPSMQSIHQCWDPQVVIEIAWNCKVSTLVIFWNRNSPGTVQRHEASRAQPRQTWQTLKPPALGTEVHPENWSGVLNKSRIACFNKQREKEKEKACTEAVTLADFRKITSKHEPDFFQAQGFLCTSQRLKGFAEINGVWLWLRCDCI